MDALQSSVAGVWRPMPPCRSCYRGHRHFTVANALAGIAWSELGAEFACRVPRGHAACLCGSLPVRLDRTRRELLALGRSFGHSSFCHSCRARFEALALVPAIGIVAHGLAWDSWHYRNSTY